MLYYDPTESGVTLTIGKDACYYHPNTKGIHWNEERQPFGYAGVRRLFEALELAVTEQAEGNVLQKQVEVIGSKSQVQNRVKNHCSKRKWTKKKTFMYVAFGKD